MHLGRDYPAQRIPVLNTCLLARRGDDIVIGDFGIIVEISILYDLNLH